MVSIGMSSNGSTTSSSAASELEQQQLSNPKGPLRNNGHSGPNTARGLPNTVVSGVSDCHQVQQQQDMVVSSKKYLISLFKMLFSS